MIGWKLRMSFARYSRDQAVRRPMRSSGGPANVSSANQIAAEAIGGARDRRVARLQNTRSGHLEQIAIRWNRRGRSTSRESARKPKLERFHVDRNSWPCGLGGQGTAKAEAGDFLRQLFGVGQWRMLA